MSNTHYEGLEANILNLHLFEAARIEDPCIWVADTMPDMRPESWNPFNNDAVSMGTPLIDNLTMMHTSSNRGFYGRFYLANSNTGQRTALIPMTQKPRPKKLIRISEVAKKDLADDMFHIVGFNSRRYSDTKDLFDGYMSLSSVSNLRDPKNPSYTPYGPLFKRPYYWVHGNVGILVCPGVTRALPELSHYLDGDFVDEKALEEAHRTMCETLVAQGIDDPI